MHRRVREVGGSADAGRARMVSEDGDPQGTLAGVMPADKALGQELRQAYAKLVPVASGRPMSTTRLPVMDFRFFSGASPGLSVPYLTGDERIETLNLSAGGEGLPFFSPTIAHASGSISVAVWSCSRR